MKTRYVRLATVGALLLASCGAPNGGSPTTVPDTGGGGVTLGAAPPDPAAAQKAGTFAVVDQPMGWPGVSQGAGTGVNPGGGGGATSPAPTSMFSQWFQVNSTVMQQVRVTSVNASSSRPNFPVGNAVDGNLSTAWGPAAGDPSPTLVLNLAQATNLTAVAIKRSPDGVTVDVAVSADGGAWDTVETGLTPHSGQLDWFDLPNVRADRVRFTFHGDASQILVCEAEAFGGFVAGGGGGSTPAPTPVPGTTPSPTPTPGVTPTPGGTPTPMPTPGMTPTPTPTPVETPTPPPHRECGCDVTGGGFVFTSLGEKVTFGFVAHHLGNGMVGGNIQVVAHNSARFHGRVTAITCDDDTATFTGSLVGGGTFTCTVVDNGEPGIHDRFSFSTSTGFTVGGLLGNGGPGGGNIQLHHRKCDGDHDHDVGDNGGIHHDD